MLNSREHGIPDQVAVSLEGKYVCMPTKRCMRRREKEEEEEYVLCELVVERE